MKKITTPFFITIAFAPMIFLAFIYNRLPQEVPIHFDMKMEPDEVADKSMLWILTGILTFVSILLFFVLKNIHKIDPKRKNDANAPAMFGKLAGGLVVFMSALGIVIILSTYDSGYSLNNLLFPLLGLMFAFMGNYMINIKPNYIAGMRLPWTLNDDENWRKTHKIGGKLWFWGGLIFAIISLFIPFESLIWVFICMMTVMVIIPIVYSYRLYRNKG